MSKSNTLAIIVGGSSGMGKEAAKRLLTEGTPVLLLSSNPEKLTTAKQDLEQQTGGQVEPYAVDL